MKPKQQVRRVLDKLPAPEIGHKVRQSLADIERDAVVSLEDAESRLNRRLFIHDHPRSQ